MTLTFFVHFVLLFIICFSNVLYDASTHHHTIPVVVQVISYKSPSYVAGVIEDPLIVLCATY